MSAPACLLSSPTTHLTAPSNPRPHAPPHTPHSPVADGRVLALKQVKLAGMKRVDRQEAIDEVKGGSRLPLWARVWVLHHACHLIGYKLT